MYLVSFYNPSRNADYLKDTVIALCYTFQKGSAPSPHGEMIILNTTADGVTAMNVTGGYALIDCWGRGIQDILVGTIDCAGI